MAAPISAPIASTIPRSTTSLPGSNRLATSAQRSATAAASRCAAGSGIRNCSASALSHFLKRRRPAVSLRVAIQLHRSQSPPASATPRRPAARFGRLALPSRMTAPWGATEIQWSDRGGSQKFESAVSIRRCWPRLPVRAQCR